MRDDKEVMENPYLQSPDLQSPDLESFGVACFGRRDTRPIMPPWQREKPVKMMNSLPASRR
jgi:hypothetical protein